MPDLSGDPFYAHLEFTGSRSRGLPLGDPTTWVDSGRFVHPTQRRVWRLMLDILRLLQIGATAGQTLERVLGHATFLALIRRE
eukprot:12417981-Heterocapsa_arctica.AAC.1